MTGAIALKSMPFDSNEVYNEATGETTFDRVAFSKDLADWMRNYFSNGILVKGSNVITDQLKVTHSGGLKLSVNKGEVIINGRTGWVESATELTVDIGGSNDRIDRIVMELSLTDRYIYLKLIKGTEASSPIAPALTQTEDIFQIPLAQVRVNAETAVIASVTDERQDYISNVTIGIEPPTANSAVAISVSPEVQQLIGVDDVDKCLKKLPFLSLKSDWKLISDNAFNIPKTNFSTVDGSTNYRSTIKQSFVILNRDIISKYNNFYIKTENVHIDFDCVKTSSTDTSYYRNYYFDVSPEYDVKRGEATWRGSYGYYKENENVNKYLEDSYSFIFTKNINEINTEFLTNCFDVLAEKQILTRSSDPVKQRTTKLEFDVDGNIMFEVSVSCSVEKYGIQGSGGVSGNVKVYGR